MPDSNLPLILAISGASGSVYGMTLAKMILEASVPLHLIISHSSVQIMEQETGIKIKNWLESCKELGNLTVHDIKDFSASIASGSFRTRGMIIAPCSMGSLARIASGISSSLIERAADVCLKERRTLILMARETPLSLIHLENMLSLTKAGAVIMPPVPAFYSSPRTLNEMVEHTVFRVLDQFDFELPDSFRWKASISESEMPEIS
jgi:flavin prenyltransferase